MIVPGGGISPDGSKWVSSRPNFFLPVREIGEHSLRSAKRFLGINHPFGLAQRFEIVIKLCPICECGVMAQELQFACLPMSLSAAF